MINLVFDRDRNSAFKILCLGAHSDDIEIGCGGTILRLISEYPQLCVYWVVFGSDQIRAEEALKSANALLAPVAEKTVIIKGFRDSFFPYVGSEIKEYFEAFRSEYSPDVIFTHYRDDRHQDHRLISDLTWNTFRDHFILEYEIPKYDGDLGSPNFFFHLNEQICQRKVQHLLSYFKTQTDRSWFTEDTFLALLRLRGVEARSPVKYAEAFYCRKLTF
jgi:LmbE family N-acetylglucosaminyl deacetylase